MMESTWASGAVELLRHADSHIDLNSAFDKRIAFISIDNSVESMIRTFLSLPRSKSNIKVSKQEIEDAGNSFPKLLSLLSKHASDKMIGIDEGDIEHYHRIRNTLYHQGTGLSVDDQYLMAYRGIAGVLLQNLFQVSLVTTAPEAGSLEKLIMNWNSIERLIRERTEAKGVSATHKWEELFAVGLTDKGDAELFKELRAARNRLVHSQSIDREELGQWIEKSERFLKKLSDTPTTESPATVAFSYQKLEIASEMHHYSLTASITLDRPPDQKSFRLTILWPLLVRMQGQGFGMGEEKDIDGVRYIELSVEIEQRLWPGQTVKVIGGKATPRLQYMVDQASYSKLEERPAFMYFTLYLPDWQPVRGSVEFEKLNEF